MTKDDVMKATCAISQFARGSMSAIDREEDEFHRQVIEDRKMARKARRAQKKQLADRLGWRKVDVDINQLMLGSKESGFLGLEELDYDTWVAQSKAMGIDPEKALTLADDKEDQFEENSDQISSDQPVTSDAAVDAGKKSKVTPNETNEKKKKKKKEKKTNKQLDSNSTAPPPAKAEGVSAESENGKREGVKGEEEEGGETDATFELGTGWREFELEPEIVRALQTLRFKEPTPIQKEVIRKGLVAGCDVLAASETGSGKTLAFGIPIIQQIIQAMKIRSVNVIEALILAPTRELALQVCAHLKELAKFTKIKIAPMVGGMSVDKQQRLLRAQPHVIVATPGRLWELVSSGQAPYLMEMRKIRFLVLDEADRMVENGHFAELDNILAMLPSRKGIARDAPKEKIDKQTKRREKKGKEKERKRNKRKKGSDEEQSEEGADANDQLEGDEEDGDDYEQEFPQPTTNSRKRKSAVEEEEDAEDEGDLEGDYEVGDDADGLAAEEEDNLGEDEEGAAGSSLEEPEEDQDDELEGDEEHDQADEEQKQAPEKKVPAVNGDDSVADLLSTLPKTDINAPKRQTFVLSATLTAQYKSFSAVSELIKRIEFQRKQHIVDLTPKQMTATRLSEAKIECPTDEKDVFLTYFLRENPGRTIVFANSINSIRRLVSILSRLRFPVYPLHAQMQQRQRLKNLERFRKNDKVVLLATDVAARGLDIDLVQHVVHYQLPLTAELYVHRSGRTARASAGGLSLALVAPEEKQKLVSICRFLKKTDLPVFPVRRTLLPAIQKCVILSRKIDQKLHSAERKQANQRWVKTQSAAMDMEPEEDLVEDDEDVQSRQKNAKKHAAELVAQLNALLEKWQLSKGVVSSATPSDSAGSTKKEKEATAVSAQTEKPKNRKQLRREKQAAKRAKTEAAAAAAPATAPPAEPPKVNIPVFALPEMLSRARRDAADILRAKHETKKKKKKFTKRKKGKGRR